MTRTFRLSAILCWILLALAAVAGDPARADRVKIGLMDDQSSVYSSLARMLKDTLSRLDTVLDHPAYNFMLHTSPVGEEINDHYHWHFEIMPKLTKVAGFEWGTGFYICPTPPEESARFLREAQVTATSVA